MKTIQKFRKSIHLIVLVGITLFSGMQCEKEFPPGTPEIDKLPKITQTGANKFGCLVDGKAFIPRGSVFSGPKLQCNYQNLGVGNEPEYFFVLAASDKETYPNQIPGVSITGDAIVLQVKTFVLAQDNTKGQFAGKYSIITNNSQTDKYYITSQISQGELTVTHFDPVNRIVSGIFWFDAINSDGIKVEVREGRFDVKF